MEEKTEDKMELIKRVEALKKTRVKGLVDIRLKEFRQLGGACVEEVFKELSFCMLTANFSAERAMKIQEDVGDGFLDLPEKRLAKKLRELGHRYPNARAKFIAESRKHRDSLKGTLSSFKDQKELREWLVRNVKGLGYKEASHFLRNIGFYDLAIIDFHIVDVLEKHGMIERPKTMTKRKYMEVENVLRGIAKKAGMSLAELDLYLWYMETGKILK
jgi:N-glycosylase/DNA lyase